MRAPSGSVARQARPWAPRSQQGWILTLICSTGISALIALAGGALVAGNEARGSVVGLISISGVLALGANVPIARRAVGNRALLATMIGALGLLPALFFAALISHGNPIIAGDWTCGTGAITTVIFGVPFAALCVSVSTGVGVWAARVPRPRLRVGLAALAVMGVSVAAVLLASSLSHFDRPQPDAWPDTVPLVATIAFDDAETGAVGRETHRVDATTAIERLCVAETWSEGRSHCAVRLRSVLPASDVGSLPACGEGDGCADAGGCGSRHEMGVLATSALRVRRDARNGLWVVNAGLHDELDLAFDDDLNPAWVEPATVARDVAPPWPWILAASLGLIGSLLALWRRLRLLRLIRRLRSGRVGRVDDGSLHFDDGELPARGAIEAPVPDGPVVAHAMRAPGHASYRGDGTKSAWTATAGTRTAQIEAARDAIVGWDALALVVSFSTALPLLVVTAAAGLF